MLTLRAFGRIETLAVVSGLVLLALGVGMTQPPKATPKPRAGHKAEALFARAKPDDFLGNEACADCHEEKVKNFGRSPHAALTSDPKLPLNKRGCEGCHGPGGIHRSEENPEVISFTKMSPEDSSAACLRCHSDTMSTQHWKVEQHARAGMSCVSCHQIHPDSDSDAPEHALNKGNAVDPRKSVFVARVQSQAMLKADQATLCGQCHASQTSEFRLPNHHPIPEGRMLCTDCHAPHPTKDSKVRRDPIKDKCVTCHQEMAGPFVYEHDPMTGGTGNGCIECHRPHGSANPKLLVGTTRGVCAQCHSDKLATHYPGQTCWTTGCHVAPHGSNTDPHLLDH